MSNSKTFFVNGHEYSANSNLTILNMVNYFDYNSSLLVLEYNSQICNRKDWNKIYIQTNDKIEIVTIVGGG